LVQNFFLYLLVRFTSTQGTVEKDTSKLLVPTLEVFKNSDYLVVATTGGSGTKELQKKYASDNIIVEDFIPFSEVMPNADVYITNGGYGGVMLSIENKLLTYAQKNQHHRE